ncbi:MAG TPA: hypothetical protein VI790_03250, partial [Candidatus Nanoarchaeia archaeon]|nr:hypothetical protein [Candidatus Nanoarchaeia archaeon]
MKQEILQNLETIYSDYLIKNSGLTGYNNIIHSHGSILAFLQSIGTRKGLFNGLLSAPVFDTECIETEVIGSLLPNGDLVGPYNTETKNYDKPLVPQSFGAAIVFGDTYITYGIVDQLKAVLQYYGENELDNNGNTVLDYLIAYDENDDKIEFGEMELRDDQYCLESKIKGKYSGNAGNFETDSASQQNASEYDVSIKQPAKIENGKIILRSNTVYNSTSRFKTRQKEVRPEYKKNHELTKHEIGTLIALRQGVAYSNSLGHEIRLEIPERNPTDNFRNLQTL